MQGATRWNTFVVLALAGSLYDKLGIELTAVAMVAMIPVLNLINVWTLAHYAAEKPRAGRAIAGELAGNPMIWSCIVGLALNLLGIPVPEPIYVFVESLGRASLAARALDGRRGLTPSRPGAPIAGGGDRNRAQADRDAGDRDWACAAARRRRAEPCGRRLLRVGADRAGCLRDGPADGRRCRLMAQILTLQTVLAVFTMPVAIALVA